MMKLMVTCLQGHLKKTASVGFSAEVEFSAGASASATRIGVIQVVQRKRAAATTTAAATASSTRMKATCLQPWLAWLAKFFCP